MLVSVSDTSPSQAQSLEEGKQTTYILGVQPTSGPRASEIEGSGKTPVSSFSVLSGADLGECSGKDRVLGACHISEDKPWSPTGI